MLTVKTKDGRAEFGPLDTIEGTASWNLQERPERVRLFLMWYTMGKGDEDVAIVDEIEFDGAGSDEERPFSLKLPDQPYSFEGQLISLQWVLEMLTEDPDEVTRLDIMVSPWVEKVVLPADESNQKIDLSDSDD